MTVVRLERELAGRKLVLETGRLAKQADAAVLVTYGETVILACVQSAAPREGLDFFPLLVDYREKTYAAGKFPGGFFKREARPTDKETLTSRLIDRPMRPLFPEGFKDDVQVLITVLSYDGENDPDIPSMIGAFAAVNIATIPFEGPMGACRVGLVGDHFIVNPTAAENAKSELELVLAATKDAITMVEAGAKELDEATMIEALETGHDACREVCAIIADFMKEAGKKKTTFTPPPVDEKLHAEVEKKFYRKIVKAVTSPGSKHERKDKVSAVKDEIVEFYAKSFSKLAADEAAKSMKAVKAHAYTLTSRAEREAILKGKRTDGRGTTDIRPITCTVGELPRAHGSSVFTRGETQALVVATLGTKDDEQIIDGLGEEARRRFLLHYNFPPFSVGETRPVRGPGRREIGHGALALRGLESVLPTAEEFPYTIRLVSEILESNGSSSMATVCGGTLALMDAGVPIRQPVAGIAMGLVKEGRKTAILSDIQGSEDHCGDMDFKVTGTQNGITALQMDIKCKGLTRKLMEQALEQAREGRVHILKEMLSSLRRPRESLSAYAPRLVRLKIDPEKIGMIIGPGGKHIRGLQDQTKTRISVDDDGTVIVAGLDAKGVDHAVRTIEAMTADVEVGRTYKGKVVSIKEFGAFVEILPGQEGLCHVSELSDEFIRSVTEVVQVGDEIDVKVLDVDPLGKIKLSRKALLEGAGDSRAPRRERGPRDDEERRPRRDRDGRDEERRPRRERDERDEERRPRRDRDDRDEERRPHRERGPRRERGDRVEVEREFDEERPRRSRDRGDRGGRGGREEAPRERHEGRAEGYDEERPHRRERDRGRDFEEDRPRRGRGREREAGAEDRSSRRPRDDRPERSDRRPQPEVEFDYEEEAPRRRGGRDRDRFDEDRPRRPRRDAFDEDRPRRVEAVEADPDFDDIPRRDRDVEDKGERAPRRGRRGRRDAEPDAPRPRRGDEFETDVEAPLRSRRSSSREDEPRGRGRGRGAAVGNDAPDFDEPVPSVRDEGDDRARKRRNRRTTEETTSSRTRSTARESGPVDDEFEAPRPRRRRARAPRD
ncbi:MAG: polyribonucleotide nucleotidyltransferase [Planctomycetes bacterium]|nr:polyribonucleotide nucleotidyltransferase [Planctomycetota bacterium]